MHIEPLPHLDTSTFKNALRRFFSIRGVCRSIRSDQGTNFIGARNQDISDNVVSVPDLEEVMKFHRCEWLLNPPKASHFGGIWERKIGSVKRILDSCLVEINPRKLTCDEFHTCLQEAAAIINNTPMWEISNDPNEPYPLTPANLITLKDSPNPPPLESYSKADIIAYGPRRCRRVQFISDQFWHRWKHEYIHHLQPRKKWITEKRSVKVGDVVLLKDRTIKRNCWPMAIVSEVKVSSDGLVRSVCLRVSSRDGSPPKTLVRPINDIVLLLETS